MVETIINCECDFLLPPGLVLSGQDSLDLSSDLEFQAHFTVEPRFTLLLIILSVDGKILCPFAII